MWNYRVLKDKHKTLIISEVYYNDKNEPYAACDISLIGDDIPELKKEIKLIEEALEHPILDEESIYTTPQKMRERDVESTL